MQALDLHSRIDALSDGEVYALPRSFTFELGNLLFERAVSDHLVVKIPSRVSRDRHSCGGWRDYLRHIRDGVTDPGWERKPDDDECWARRDRLFDRYSALKKLCADHQEETVHFLAIHKLHHDRLSRVIRVPKTRFVIGSRPIWFGLYRTKWPVIIQQRVPGVPLWEMIDQKTGAGGLKSEWERYREPIRQHLRILLHSQVDADWSPENFVFDSETQTLYYVDVKCGAMMPAASNSHNFPLIKQDFGLGDS